MAVPVVVAASVVVAIPEEAEVASDLEVEPSPEAQEAGRPEWPFRVATALQWLGAVAFEPESK